MQRHFQRYEQVLKELSGVALKASLRELELTPKPGLVDMASPGAHADMDYQLLQRSAYCLSRFWYDFLVSGFKFSFYQGGDALFCIREVGLEAERVMFSATDGVNTHKGLIFLYGVLLFCIGFLLGKRDYDWSFGDLRDAVKDVARGLVERELEPVRLGNREAKTHGEIVYLRYGVGGAREEVEKGLPSVFDVGLPVLESYMSMGISMNEAYLRTLAGLLEVVDDTNVLFRRGKEGLLWMREKVRGLSNSGMHFAEGLRLLDEDFTREGISPGGTADILTLVIFLYHAKRILEAAS